jgi:hypothetical protein
MFINVYLKELYDDVVNEIIQICNKNKIIF